MVSSSKTVYIADTAPTHCRHSAGRSPKGIAMSVLSDYERETAALPHRSHALPLPVYSDSGIFDLEMERVFRRDWIALCGADELSESGDYYALTVAGEPIVVIRGPDGELRCFSNLCRHRGTVLYDDGRGHARSVQCPYHAWSYDNIGRLTGVPFPGNAVIDKAAHGLIAIRLETWKDVVFINFEPDAEPFAPRLAGLDRYVDPFQYDRFESAPPAKERSCNANWKLILENGMDWYHLFQAHPESLDPIAPTRDAFNIEGSPAWTVTASRLTHATPKRADDPPSLADFEREHYLVISVPPNIVFFANADGWGWLLVLPQSAGRTLICEGGRYSEHEDGPAAAELKSYQQVAEEDLILCERIQKGMSSHHGRGGQLVELDRAITDFHHYLGWRLFDHELAEPWKAKFER
jgi:phenylpropionate dioxygenase-like ring-hydroxylating dioxygenase large terminal subunit